MLRSHGIRRRQRLTHTCLLAWQIAAADAALACHLRSRRAERAKARAVGAWRAQGQVQARTRQHLAGITARQSLAVLGRVLRGWLLAHRLRLKRRGNVSALTSRRAQRLQRLSLGCWVHAHAREERRRAGLGQRCGALAQRRCGRLLCVAVGQWRACAAEQAAAARLPWEAIECRGRQVMNGAWADGP